MAIKMRDARGAKPLDQEIGIRVRARQRELQIAQQEVAEALGISFQQVQKYERSATRI
jgi:transcriptional regulator with XRE-family HTH domain